MDELTKEDIDKKMINVEVPTTMEKNEIKLFVKIEAPAEEENGRNKHRPSSK